MIVITNTIQIAEVLKKMTESEIKYRGMEALVHALGEVNAEKFIALINREPFDYTKWQRHLWTDKTVDDIIHLTENKGSRQK